MKKMKKILAMLLALTMILGMGLTAMAATAPAETASITVEGLTANDNTVLKIYPVVVLDIEKSTWKVADWVKTLETTDEKTYVNLTAAQITIDWNSLSSKVPESALKESYTLQENETSYTFGGLAVGAYMIKATGDNTTYNVMGEGTYSYDDDNHLIVPVDKEISAKGSSYQVTKKLQDEEKDFVAKGDTVVFDIETVFPSYPDKETNRRFYITDTPQGMKITAVKVYVNSDELSAEGNYTVSELNIPDRAVTVTFTEEYIGNENAHATESVRVEVTAVITADDVYSNKANSNYDSEPAEVSGDTGSLTINKVDNTASKNPLQGAKFEIKLNDTVLSFAPTDVAGVYTLVAGGTTTANTDVFLVESPESGVIVLKGLGAGTYKIEEKEAPAGYSVVTVPDVIIAEGENADKAIEVINTKLIALPSTGGIGTTIFTVAGCGIMIAAAFFFFASRKKEN